MEIQVRKGLDLPLINQAGGGVESMQIGKKAALDVSAHENLHFQKLVSIGDAVAQGAPLLADKSYPDRVFVAPVSGHVVDIVRGEKRRILSIVIEVDGNIAPKTLKPLSGNDQLIKRLLEGGAFAAILQRPCSVLAAPDKKPEAIFINAIASEPYLPDPKLELEGKTAEFHAGLTALSSLAPVHLVGLDGYKEAKCHQVKGPHPVGNPSVHIHHIHPMKRPEQIIWTLTLHDVICIGALTQGVFYSKRVIAIAGNGACPEKTGFFRVNVGACVGELIEGRTIEEEVCLISGSPLTGKKVEKTDFLGASHTALCAIKKKQKRAFLHFLGLGKKSYTATRAYISKPDFSTLMHGETRAFVDGAYYDKYMPMKIPVMALIKAILAEDFDQAVQLGLLEVAPEDFALPAFACPSKINMPDIVRQGQFLYASQYLSGD